MSVWLACIVELHGTLKPCPSPQSGHAQQKQDPGVLFTILMWVSGHWQLAKPTGFPSVTSLQAIKTYKAVNSSFRFNVGTTRPERQVLKIVNFPQC